MGGEQEEETGINPVSEQEEEEFEELKEHAIDYYWNDTIEED